MSAEGETRLLGRIPSTGLPEILGASSGTGNPPPLMPDIWLAAITAAMQAHVDLSTATQPVTAATISSMLGRAQTRKLIPPPTAASARDFL
jgi:hypothetical protein